MCAKSQFDLSARALFNFLFDGQIENKYLAMIYRAYLDDSADRKRERVVVSGAVIGNDEKWGFLDRRWKKRLDEDELLYFKSSHCNSLNGQFHKFRTLSNGEGKKKADQVRDDLDGIIRTSRVITLGVVVPVRFHNIMLDDSAKFGPIPEVPYRLAFQQTLAECAYAMIHMGHNNLVNFGHDDGDDFDELRAIFKEFKKANPRYARVMMDFVPLDDKIHCPIQAADVAAWVTSRYAEEWAINPTTDNLTRLRSSMYKMIIWTERMGDPSLQARYGAPARAKYVI